jgi:hypothetical protein
MYLIRDIMYCKPGKVRPMVEKIMQRYHDLVDHGKREIYKLEG